MASMGIALSLVSRSPLTIAQKLVQARVYAQGLTLAVLIATAAFEISDQRNDQGRYETVQTFDAEDPTHMKTIERKVHREEYQGEDQWKGMILQICFVWIPVLIIVVDMVEAEERRLKQRDEQLKEYEAEHHKKLHKKSKMDDQHDKHDDQDKGAGKDGQKDGEKK